MADLAKIKKLFFTSDFVKNSIDKGTRQALSKFGAFVRRRAKSSLKYSKGAARPGQPPHVHRSTGHVKVSRSKKGPPKKQPASPLRELIFFSFDPVRKSVVIGPTLGGSRSGAPRNLEDGGAARIDGKTVVIRPRPTMRPAFQSELVKVGGDFRNIIK